MAIAHWAALPHPAARDPVLERAVRAARPAHARGVFALHILYGSCRCSERILEQLRARGPSAEAEELVVLVSPRGRQQSETEAKGFGVLALTPRQLSLRFPLRAAPLLVVADAAHTLRYVGGYTARNQAGAPIDAQVIRGVSRGESLRELPVFGCAMSRALQRALDPLGLKYGFQDGEP